jgi:hypothetical protein
MDGWIEQVERLPRLVRIVLSMVTAVVLTITVWVLITMVLGTDVAGNSAARLLVLFGAGLPLYAYGWWVLVGFERSDGGEWRADQQSVWYLSAGCIGLVLVVVLVLVALATSDLL